MSCIAESTLINGRNLVGCWIQMGFEWDGHELEMTWKRDIFSLQALLSCGAPSVCIVAKASEAQVIITLQNVYSRMHAGLISRRQHTTGGISRPVSMALTYAM